jgi:hypothetical protein
LNSTDVSDKHIASIFRLEELARKQYEASSKIKLGVIS